ncbi:MAG: hypothetical protein Q9221_005660 [Calogaya cf. arnoldii]
MSDSSPSFRHIASHLRLKTGQTNHPTNIPARESTIPSPRLGEGPIMFVNSIEDAMEPGQMMKSPFPTASMMSEAISFEDGKRDSSSAILLFVANPCMRFVSCVFVSCSRTNPGEMKSAGNAQWMV